jgi:hypothetical protein
MTSHNRHHAGPMRFTNPESYRPQISLGPFNLKKKKKRTTTNTNTKQDKDYFEGCYRTELMRRLLANKYGEGTQAVSRQTDRQTKQSKQCVYAWDVWWCAVCSAWHRKHSPTHTPTHTPTYLIRCGEGGPLAPAFGARRALRAARPAHAQRDGGQQGARAGGWVGE